MPYIIGIIISSNKKKKPYSNVSINCLTVFKSKNLMVMYKMKIKFLFNLIKWIKFHPFYRRYIINYTILGVFYKKKFKN